MNETAQNPTQQLDLQKLLRNSAHALGEVSGLLADLEISLAEMASQETSISHDWLGQDFDLLSQTIDELRGFLERLSCCPSVVGQVPSADVLAQVKLANLRDLVGADDAPLPSLRNENDASAIQLF